MFTKDADIRNLQLPRNSISENGELNKNLLMMTTEVLVVMKSIDSTKNRERMDKET